MAHVRSNRSPIEAAAALDRVLAEATDLEQRLRLVVDHIDGRVAFSTSLGLEDQAVLHGIAVSQAPIDVFTLDTGRLFAETFDAIANSEARYDFKIRVVVPEAADVEALVSHDGVYGFRNSLEARKACCEIRKVRPLRRALSGAKGWVTGLRRGQSSGRQQVPFAEFDAGFNLIKINPIADWSLEELEAFIAGNRIPVNALHARGFPSIGCQPCTRAIAAGEDIRAGRWWWELEKGQSNGQECGLHSSPAAVKETA